MTPDQYVLLTNYEQQLHSAYAADTETKNISIVMSVDTENALSITVPLKML